jgi:hypothetical protein
MNHLIIKPTLLLPGYWEKDKDCGMPTLSVAGVQKSYSILLSNLDGSTTMGQNGSEIATTDK